LTPSDLILIAVAFVFGANNMGVIRSSFRNVSGRAAAAYTGVGVLAFCAGYLVEGFKVKSTLTTGLAAASPSTLAAPLAVLLVMVAFTSFRLPASLSNVLLGATVGVALATGTEVKTGALVSVLGAWLISPLSASLVALALHRGALSMETHRPLTWISRWSRNVGLLAVALASYTLGANNLGALLGYSSGTTATLAVLAAAIAGGVLFGRSVAWLLGWRMAVLSPSAYLSALLGASATLWIYTQVGIPTSLTQAIVGAMMVLSLDRKPTMINPKVVFEVLGSWPLLLVSATIVAYVTAIVV
jgi:phosphate/sulfate permease